MTTVASGTIWTMAESTGQQVFPPPAVAIRRLFSRINLDFPGKDFPQVGSITRLIIRRRMRRSFFPVTLNDVLDKLNAVEQLVYEPWRQWDNRSRKFHDPCK